jgi:hypothetical protein
MPDYFAYLLRIWRGDSREQAAWRAALEDPHTRQVIAFGSIEALCRYLVQLSEASSKENQPRPGSDCEEPSPNLLRQDDYSQKGN